jgi:transcriptional regulator with XRE-family HTH domain
MAKPEDPRDTFARKNMVAFRKEAGMSQADAADTAGIALDNLRRYENGTTTTIPGSVIEALAKAYGHAMEDFYSPSPPKARLEERATFFLRTRPGAEIDAKMYAELNDIIEKANRAAAGKRKKT